jgi:hypothetical protein
MQLEINPTQGNKESTTPLVKDNKGRGIDFKSDKEAWKEKKIEEKYEPIASAVPDKYVIEAEYV